MRKYIYLTILLLICSTAHASYITEVLKVTKNNGYRTFTIKITDSGTGEIRIGERMFGPSASIPTTQAQIDALAVVLYPQFKKEVDFDDSTAFVTTKKKFLNDLPTNAEINAISNLAEAKVELKNFRKALIDLAKIIKEELRR